MYDLKLGQNGRFNEKNQQKNHVFFMPHAFSQNEHPFGQCEHFNQVEPFEKPCFFIVPLVIFLLVLICICFLLFPIVVLLPSLLSCV
jgi:hypothetical protein